MRKNLAQFVRTHEKALANALQLRRQAVRHGNPQSPNGDASPTHMGSFQSSPPTQSATSALAAALSLGALSFTSQSVKPAKLTLTAHHLFYLLSRFEELGIAIGPMNIRLENIHADTSPGNYVSFLSQTQRSKGRSDRDSIHSVSSVRSVMSSMSSLWSNLGVSSAGNTAKSDKAKAQAQADLKYLYSAFTKIPCLRLSPDRKARLIKGYEEFPFDSAVPLLAFKNISALEICDIDFRQFFGWDKLADQLRSLTLKRAQVDDPTDLLIGIVLDDMDKRRRRSSKAQGSPNTPWPASPSPRFGEFGRAQSAPSSPVADDRFGKNSSPQDSLYVRGDSEIARSPVQKRTKSTSPTRPTSSRHGSSYRHNKSGDGKIKRSGSGSSNSSTHSLVPPRTRSASNLLSMGILPASKWRFLKHLSLPDNGLTSLSASSLSPLANTLHSLDLSSNLFSEIPDCLATLTALRALNLSNCMIESLHSLARNPLPAIIALNLRANRLSSIAGIERLLSLERLDLRNNRLTDPTEMARLTGTPEIREIWVMGNPFVKIHTGYRITVFNLFRATPGYTEDIIIDAAAPGYSERRQLKDRVAEAEGVPIVKYSIGNQTPMATTHRSDSLSTPSTLTKVSIAHSLTRPLLDSSQSEVTIGSTRRRKGPRRRIVDLSQDDGQLLNNALDRSPRRPQVAFVDLNGTGASNAENSSSRIEATTQEQRENSSPQQKFGSHNPLLQPSPFPNEEPIITDSQKLADELQSLNLDGEAYRRKVEALKDEFGTGWLSVLGDEEWNGRQPTEAAVAKVPSARSPHTKPELPPHARVANQGIVSSYRTLG